MHLIELKPAKASVNIAFLAWAKREIGDRLVQVRGRGDMMFRLDYDPEMSSNYGYVAIGDGKMISRLYAVSDEGDRDAILSTWGKRVATTGEFEFDSIPVYKGVAKGILRERPDLHDEAAALAAFKATCLAPRPDDVEIQVDYEAFEAIEALADSLAELPKRVLAGDELLDDRLHPLARHDLELIAAITRHLDEYTDFPATVTLGPGTVSVLRELAAWLSTDETRDETQVVLGKRKQVTIGDLRLAAGVIDDAPAPKP